MKLITTLGLVTAFVVTQSAYAEGMSYDYVEGGYRHFTWNASAAGYPDHNYNGAFLGGSKSLNEHFFIQGAVAYVESSWNDPGDHEELEQTDIMASVGARFPINANTDLNASVGVWSYSGTISSQKDRRTYGGSGDFVRTSLGLRHRLNAKTELNGSYDHATANQNETDLTYVNFGVTHEIAPHYKLGITLFKTLSHDIRGGDIYLRYDF